jgi:hypothetical protein
MSFEDIIPHLNKFATLYLRGNKKKVGWMFLESGHSNNNHQHTIKEVYFVNVQKGKRLVHALDTDDKDELKTVSESISINEIVRIRSSK